MKIRVIALVWDRQFTGGTVEVDVTDCVRKFDLSHPVARNNALWDVKKMYGQDLVDIFVEEDLP